MSFNGSFTFPALKMRTAVTAVSLSAALFAYGAYVPTEANAATTTESTESSISTTSDGTSVTPEQVASAVAEIKQSNLLYNTFTTDGQRYISVVFGTGSTINLPDSGPLSNGERVIAPPKGATPNIGGGGGISSPYVKFNRADQNALIAGGSAAAAGLVCLAGPAACVVAGIIAAVAFSYVSSYGRCSGSRPTLRVYVYPPQRINNGCYR